MPHDLTLLRLLQLASPALPIGAYAYSQGLEWAVEAGWVADEAGLEAWLRETMATTIAQVDIPCFARLLAAARARDEAMLAAWTARLLACRETAELRADDCARGAALARLLRDLEMPMEARGACGQELPLARVYARIVAAWQLPEGPAAEAFAWGWLENQAICGVKLIPLGQVAGQRVLYRLAGSIPALVAEGLACADDAIGGTLPALAIASSRHATQYTRLFRS
jgi:urease accessory protein